MAPMRGERGGSPARAARASLPLPRRLIRQIARHVASSGRSLQRLEISGRVIDNFDDLYADDSDTDPGSPIVASAGGVSAAQAEHDDDLTSLSWLQDRNLLRGINLSKGDNDENKPVAGQIMYQSAELNCGDSPPPGVRPPSPPATPIKVSLPAPVSPPVMDLLPSHAKPPYSFSCLIFMAIEAAPTRALPVKEIYAWIIRHFPYFREAPQGWKNSVRHNLSLNKCFHKVATATTLGKGSLWTVDPQHRPGLMQAFGRQPIPQPVPEEPTGKNVPDPSLFPFLARRLAGEPEMRIVSTPGVDEYLAAATVLAMKYGPGVLDRLPPAPNHLVISRSPRDEHTYSGWEACDERRTAEALLNLAGVTPDPEPPAQSRKRRLHQR